MNPFVSVIGNRFAGPATLAERIGFAGIAVKGPAFGSFIGQFESLRT
jgi:hypothetical protein